MRMSMRVTALAFLALGTALVASAETIYVSTLTNQLLSFDSASPGSLLGSVTVTGLQGGETLEGIDFRPANGHLYALGSTGQLYTIDRTTGAATGIGDPLPLSGNHFGFDFDPTMDLIRVVSNQDQNLRADPDTGALVSIDTDLAFAAGDVNKGENPSVVGAGYTNNLAGSTATTLYDIELSNNALIIQSPANDGTLNTIGPLGVSAADATAGFDISGLTGTAYGAMNPGGGANLYRIDLSSGRALLTGSIAGSPSGITGLAVVSSEGTCVPSTTALCLSGDRFKVTVAWQLNDGTQGSGQALRLAGSSGYFWFFSPDNIELDVKVLNACAEFNRFWVFASGLTNVGVTITVKDTKTGAMKVYENPANQAFLPIQDTNAFATCP